MLTEKSGRKHLIGSHKWKWRVRYPDGNVSIPMAYDVACDYTIIWGGTVEKVEKESSNV